MKPGDTLRIRQADGFVTLFTHPGPANLNDPNNPETHRMTREEVGLCVAVVDYKAPDCYWLECLVLVPQAGGGARWGWRDTENFQVLPCP